MKKSKMEVQYSKGTATQYCGLCRHFLHRPFSDDACEKVAGVIDVADWCELYHSKRDGKIGENR